MSRLKISLLFSMMLIVVVTACDSKTEPASYKKVTFINCSSEDIYLGWCTSYTHTYSFDLDNYRFVYLRPDEATDVISIVYGTECPTRNLEIVIYRPETLKRYTREEIIENKIVDYSYDLPISMVEALHYTITYTGN